MKKTALALAVLMAISGSVFASANIPKRRPLPDVNLAYCLNNVEVEADNAGLKSPWVGGGASYYVFVEPKYNACQCKYFNIPWQYKNGNVDTTAWSC